MTVRGTRCKVCEHPHKDGIEQLISGATPLEVISRKFGPSVYSLCRHRKNHMTAEQMALLVQVGMSTSVDLEELERRESEGMLTTLLANRARAYRLLDAAEDAGDIKAAAQVIGRVHENINLTAKILGAITTHSTVNNINIASDWVDMRTGMMRVLRDYPEARKALSSFLLEFETQEKRETLERVHAEP